MSAALEQQLQLRSRFDSIAKPSGSLPYSSLVATTISGRPSPSRVADRRRRQALGAARSRTSTPGSGVALPVASGRSTRRAGSASRTGKPANRRAVRAPRVEVAVERARQDLERGVSPGASRSTSTGAAAKPRSMSFRRSRFSGSESAGSTATGKPRAQRAVIVEDIEIALDSPRRRSRCGRRRRGRRPRRSRSRPRAAPALRRSRSRATRAPRSRRCGSGSRAALAPLAPSKACTEPSPPPCTMSSTPSRFTSARAGELSPEPGR